MSRYGPLDANGDRLVLGDSGGHHVELTRQALVIRRYGENAEYVAWERVASISLSLQETRFRWPGVFTTVGLGAVAAVMGSSDIVGDPSSGKLIVSSPDGAQTEIELTPHHVGGYWVRTVTASKALLSRLVADADARELLDDPERVIRLVSARAS